LGQRIGNLGGVGRRHRVEQAAELPRQRFAERPGARGDDLAELDIGRAQVGERLRDLPDDLVLETATAGQLGQNPGAGAGELPARHADPGRFDRQRNPVQFGDLTVFGGTHSFQCAKPAPNTNNFARAQRRPSHLPFCRGVLHVVRREQAQNRTIRAPGMRFCDCSRGGGLLRPARAARPAGAHGRPQHELGRCEPLVGPAALASAPTFPLNPPDRQLDHILTDHPDLVVKQISSPVLPISDHRPLIIDVSPR